jgi:hypothetical protein
VALHFTNKSVWSPIRNCGFLICDIDPGAASPHVEVFLWEGFSPYRIIGWTFVSGLLDAEKSGLTPDDRTKEIQLHLNRLRRREDILSRSVGRQAWRAASLFRQDAEEISKVSGVPASTVRHFFDGKPTSDEAREKILQAFNLRPEELEMKLWEP